MTQFGTRLRAERLRLGMKQAEMAEACQLHPNSQSAYETGASWPTAEYLQQVVAMGVDVHFLFHGEYTNATIPKQVAELLAILVQLPPEQQAACFAMLSLFRQPAVAGANGVERADEVWRAARLFSQFLGSSKSEKVLMETAAGLNLEVLPKQ